MSEAALSDLVEAGVSLQLFQLSERGGPSDIDWADVQEFQRVLTEETDAGEALVVKIPGKTAKMFNWLCRTLAVMAYQPGGVDFLERHFEVSAKEGVRIGSSES